MQTLGQREMTQVVGGELPLETVGRALQVGSDDAGVVDEQVQRPVPGRDEVSDRERIGELETRDANGAVVDRGVHGVRRRLARGDVANRQSDLGPGRRERPRRLHPDSGRGPGDHGA